MKMVSRITAIGLAGVAICYLGLSGYVCGTTIINAVNRPMFRHLLSVKIIRF